MADVSQIEHEDPWTPKEESCQHGMAMWLCATPGGSRTDPHYPTHL